MNVAVNASLLEIRAAGAIAPNGDPSLGAPVWTGRADGYLRRVRRQVVGGRGTGAGRAEQSFSDERDVFVIRHAAGAPALAAAGPDWEATTVLIEDRRARPPRVSRWTVRGMENRAIGSPVDSIRLELDDERQEE